MARVVTHETIVKFHEDIVRYHKQLNGFYRFNWSEISGKFRSGIGTPALVLESHSSELDPNQNNTTTFNTRSISFLIMDFAGKADSYTKQNEVLNSTELIALDIAAYLKDKSKDRSSWIYGLYDGKVRIEKVGPLWDGMYGWNVLYDIKNLETMVVDPEVWDFNAPPL